MPKTDWLVKINVALAYWTPPPHHDHAGVVPTFSDVNLGAALNAQLAERAVAITSGKPCAPPGAWLKIGDAKWRASARGKALGAVAALNDLEEIHSALTCIVNVGGPPSSESPPPFASRARLIKRLSAASPNTMLLAWRAAALEKDTAFANECLEHIAGASKTLSAPACNALAALLYQGNLAGFCTDPPVAVLDVLLKPVLASRPVANLELVLCTLAMFASCTETLRRVVKWPHLKALAGIAEPDVLECLAKCDCLHGDVYAAAVKDLAPHCKLGGKATVFPPVGAAECALLSRLLAHRPKGDALCRNLAMGALAFLTNASTSAAAASPASSKAAKDNKPAAVEVPHAWIALVNALVNGSLAADAAADFASRVVKAITQRKPTDKQQQQQLITLSPLLMLLHGNKRPLPTELSVPLFDALFGLVREAWAEHSGERAALADDALLVMRSMDESVMATKPLAHAICVDVPMDACAAAIMAALREPNALELCVAIAATMTSESQTWETLTATTITPLLDALVSAIEFAHNAERALWLSWIEASTAASPERKAAAARMLDFPCTLITPAAKFDAISALLGAPVQQYSSPLEKDDVVDLIRWLGTARTDLALINVAVGTLSEAALDVFDNIEDGEAQKVEDDEATEARHTRVMARCPRLSSFGHDARRAAMQQESPEFIRLMAEHCCALAVQSDVLLGVMRDAIHDAAECSEDMAVCLVKLVAEAADRPLAHVRAQHFILTALPVINLASPSAPRLQAALATLAAQTPRVVNLVLRFVDQHAPYAELAHEWHPGHYLSAAHVAGMAKFLCHGLFASQPLGLLATLEHVDVATVAGASVPGSGEGGGGKLGLFVDLALQCAHTVLPPPQAEPDAAVAAQLEAFVASEHADDEAKLDDVLAVCRNDAAVKPALQYLEFCTLLLESVLLNAAAKPKGDVLAAVTMIVNAVAARTRAAEPLPLPPQLASATPPQSATAPSSSPPQHPAAAAAAPSVAAGATGAAANSANAGTQGLATWMRQLSDAAPLIRRQRLSAMFSFNGILNPRATATAHPHDTDPMDDGGHNNNNNNNDDSDGHSGDSETSSHSEGEGDGGGDCVGGGDGDSEAEALPQLSVRGYAMALEMMGDDSACTNLFEERCWHDFFACKTCSKTVCRPCARRCHGGHALKFAFARMTRNSCMCGAACKATPASSSPSPPSSSASFPPTPLQQPAPPLPHAPLAVAVFLRQERVASALLRAFDVCFGPEPLAAPAQRAVTPPPPPPELADAVVLCTDEVVTASFNLFEGAAEASEVAAWNAQCKTAASGAQQQQVLAVSEWGFAAVGACHAVALFDCGPCLMRSEVPSHPLCLCVTEIGFPVLALTFNAGLLLVIGVQGQCAVLCVRRSGHVMWKEPLARPNPGLGEVVRRTLWVPGHATRLVVVTDVAVLLYDVAQSSARPLVAWKVVENKIVDAAFVKDDNLVVVCRPHGMLRVCMRDAPDEFVDEPLILCDAIAVQSPGEWAVASLTQVAPLVLAAHLAQGFMLVMHFKDAGVLERTVRFDIVSSEDATLGPVLPLGASRFVVSLGRRGGSIMLVHCDVTPGKHKRSLCSPMAAAYGAVVGIGQWGRGRRVLALFENGYLAVVHSLVHSAASGTVQQHLPADAVFALDGMQLVAHDTELRWLYRTALSIAAPSDPAVAGNDDLKHRLAVDTSEGYLASDASIRLQVRMSCPEYAVSAVRFHVGRAPSDEGVPRSIAVFGSRAVSVGPADRLSSSQSGSPMVVDVVLTLDETLRAAATGGVFFMVGMNSDLPLVAVDAVEVYVLPLACVRSFYAAASGATTGKAAQGQRPCLSEPCAAQLASLLLNARPVRGNPSPTWRAFLKTAMAHAHTLRALFPDAADRAKFADVMRLVDVAREPSGDAKVLREVGVMSLRRPQLVESWLASNPGIEYGLTPERTGVKDALPLVALLLAAARGRGGPDAQLTDSLGSLLCTSAPRMRVAAADALFHLLFQRGGQRQVAMAAAGGDAVGVAAMAPEDAEVDDDDDGAHYKCDSCGMYPIVGPRWNCPACAEVDLCESCFFANVEHKSGHDFVSASRAGKPPLGCTSCGDIGGSSGGGRRMCDVCFIAGCTGVFVTPERMLPELLRVLVEELNASRPPADMVVLVRFLALACARVALRPFVGATRPLEALVSCLLGMLSVEQPRLASLCLVALTWAVRALRKDDATHELRRAVAKAVSAFSLDVARRHVALDAAADAAAQPSREPCVPSFLLADASAALLWEGFPKDGLYTRVPSPSRLLSSTQVLDMDESTALDPLCGLLSTLTHALPLATLVVGPGDLEAWKDVYLRTITLLRGRAARSAVGKLMGTLGLVDLGSYLLRVASFRRAMFTLRDEYVHSTAALRRLARADSASWGKFCGAFAEVGCGNPIEALVSAAAGEGADPRPALVLCLSGLQACDSDVPLSASTFGRLFAWLQDKRESVRVLAMRVLAAAMQSGTGDGNGAAVALQICKRALDAQTIVDVESLALVSHCARELRAHAPSTFASDLLGKVVAMTRVIAADPNTPLLRKCAQTFGTGGVSFVTAASPGSADADARYDGASDSDGDDDESLGMLMMDPAQLLMAAPPAQSGEGAAAAAAATTTTTTTTTSAAAAQAAAAPKVNPLALLFAPPCAHCGLVEVPFKTLPLERIKVDMHFLSNVIVCRLKEQFAVRAVHMDLSMHRRGQACTVACVKIRACTWYADRTDVDLGSLARDPSAWALVGTIPGWDAQVAVPKLSCVLPQPCTASLLSFEFVPGRDASQDERIHCPRCTKLVVSEHGVCVHCGEVVFQCRQCRNINYEDVKSFFCVECGFCRFASFSFRLDVRASADYPVIASEADYNAAVSRLFRLSREEADARINLKNARSNAFALLKRPSHGGSSSSSSAVPAEFNPDAARLHSLLVAPALLQVYSNVCSVALEGKQLRARLAEFRGGSAPVLASQGGTQCLACAHALLSAGVAALAAVLMAMPLGSDEDVAQVVRLLLVARDMRVPVRALDAETDPVVSLCAASAQAKALVVLEVARRMRAGDSGALDAVRLCERLAKDESAASPGPAMLALADVLRCRDADAEPVVAAAVDALARLCGKEPSGGAVQAQQQQQQQQQRQQASAPVPKKQRLIDLDLARMLQLQADADFFQD